jgi:hypothetical protein
MLLSKLMTTLLYREHPRTLVIKPASNIAKTSIILAPDTQSKCIVSFSDQDMIGYKLLAPRPVHGCIGIVSIENGISSFIKNLLLVSLLKRPELLILKDMIYLTLTKSYFIVSRTASMTD